MKRKYDDYTIEVRKRRKRDPHYRGYGEGFGAQIIWPCGDHMQTLGFNFVSEEEAWEKTEETAKLYPTCQEPICKKDQK